MSYRALTGEERLWAAVVRKAVNDGALKDPSPPKSAKCKRTIETYEYRLKSIPLLREEARQWVREIYKNRPHHMKIIENYWANPHCDCGRRMFWPSTVCFVCKEQEEEDGMDQSDFE